MKNKLQVLGWVLFAVCAILFIIAGVQNKDVIITLGSVVFLLACFVFIADLILK